MAKISGVSRIDLGGLCPQGGGGCRKSLKVFTVEVKMSFKHVLVMFLTNIGLKWITSEASVKTMGKIAFGA